MQLLQQASDASIIVSLCIGIISWRKIPFILKLVVIQIALGLLAEGIGIDLIKHHRHNTSFFNIYMLIDALYTCIIASLLLNQNKRLTSLILLMLGVVWAINIFYCGSDVLANWSFVINCICIVTIFFVILIKRLTDKTTKLFTQPYLWVCFAIIIYYGCNVPIFCLINYIINDNLILADKLYNINLILIITQSVLLSFAFLLSRKHFLSKQPLHE